jgi:glyoxylase-like metal-dependent hydrolase (beta-lactamase superfamily II)
VGDTIFKGAVGSTEYPGGNKTDLAHSLKKIFTLPADTILYSGHSRPALLAQEQQRNQRSMSIN